MTEYDETVTLLAAPTTWCDGARRLVELGDKRALIPLVRAFESRHEASKQCLIDAMGALGGDVEARRLIVSEDAVVRIAAIRLMVVFASDAQLDALNAVVLHDDDAMVRERAKHALAAQRQTKRWEELIASYLALPDVEMRRWAIERLVRHDGARSWQRVEDHLARECDTELRAKIGADLARRARDLT